MPATKEPQQAVTDWVVRIVSGDRVALSKAITAAESDRPKDHLISAALLAALPPSKGTIRIGITGPPGVGKSTFINAWGIQLASLGMRIAVLAVDPSSRVSMGSILGDKTRMETLSANPNVFIRPSPSGGDGGGITRRTREVVRLCEAAGFEWVLIETVGVGQSEVDIRNVVDFVLLLVQPGAGDELQGIKRGIIELADGLVITKADGDHSKAADQALADFRMALHMFPKVSGWSAQVLSCSALKGNGITDITGMVQAFRKQTQEDGSWDRRRSEQNLQWMRDSLFENMEEALHGKAGLDESRRALEKDVKEGILSPVEAADRLWKRLNPPV